MTNYQTISAKDLKELSKNGVILDVRTKMEHDEKRLCCDNINIPLDELNPKDFIKDHNIDSNKTIYLLCRGGTRAKKAADKFLNEGINNIRVIEGGIMSCEDTGEKLEGHTVTSCSNAKGYPIPLERQVRIAAGILVFLGSFLALTSNILFALLPLFVGAGLIFAGVTDRCGMALILTKAPWNKSKK